MSATLNLIGLATLLVMSLTLLSNAGIPVGVYLHVAQGYLSGIMPTQLP